MNTIIPFKFDGSAVRAVTIDGEPYLVGKDVAGLLGYANPADAIARHCKGPAKRYPLPTAGGTQDLRVLSEPDVMRLILSSYLPAAARFERWVFEEVLPAIRKNGSYSLGPPDPMKVLNDPEALRGLLLGYSTRVSELAPKAAALDRIASADGSLCITDAAKTLQVRPKDLFDLLRRQRWIFSRQGSAGAVAYQDRIASGLLEHKVTIIARSDGIPRRRPPRCA